MLNIWEKDPLLAQTALGLPIMPAADRTDPLQDQAEIG